MIALRQRRAGGGGRSILQIAEALIDDRRTLLYYHNQRIIGSMPPPKVRSSLSEAMTEQPLVKHYRRPPITEAVIDLRVVLPNPVISDLERVRSGDESSYPTVELINVATGKMQVGVAVTASATTKQTGFLFRSADGKLIQQARLDGFTLSRLAPYQSWDDFCGEARRLWAIYRSIARPSAITRAAVRYINRIDIPLPMNDFGDYLRTVPQVSPALPQALAGYFMRLLIPLDDVKSQAVVTETLIEPAAPDLVSVVLDIDVFRTEDLPSEEAELWAMFEKLRGAKNKVFEGCITAKARELFQ